MRASAFLALAERQHLVEGVVDVGDAGEGLGGGGGQRLHLERGHQRRDVVAAAHGAEQLDGLELVDLGALGLALDDLGEEGGLHLGGGIDAGGDPVDQQVEEELLLALGRLDQQLHQLAGLLRVERLRRDALLLPLRLVLQVGLDHVGPPGSGGKSVGLTDSTPGGRPVSRGAREMVRENRGLAGPDRSMIAERARARDGGEIRGGGRSSGAYGLELDGDQLGRLEHRRGRDDRLVERRPGAVALLQAALHQWLLEIEVAQLLEAADAALQARGRTPSRPAPSSRCGRPTSRRPSRSAAPGTSRSRLRIDGDGGRRQRPVRRP